MGLLNELTFFFFVLTVSAVFAGDFCYDYSYGSTYSKYCTYGCCGYLDQDCCDANIGLAVGLSILGIIVVAVIITIICCVRRRRAAYGQVIRTGGMAPGVVVTTGQTTNMTTGYPAAFPTQNYPPGVYPPPQPYPTGQQAPPAQYPYGAPVPGAPATAMAPPAYSQATGGQMNAGYDYTPQK